VQLELETYTFLTPRVSMQRANVYAVANEQILKGFSNVPSDPWDPSISLHAVAD
jgi:hypothetical protein